MKHQIVFDDETLCVSRGGNEGYFTFFTLVGTRVLSRRGEIGKIVL